MIIVILSLIPLFAMAQEPQIVGGDPDKLDALRKSVGLMPIEDYLEIVKQQGVEIIYDKTKTVADFNQ